MAISVFDLFSIGIGPSSSHTVGPIRAAKEYAFKLKSKGKLLSTKRLKIELFGSLAMTGIGHGTDKALLLGFEGYTPEDVDVEKIDGYIERIYKQNSLNLLGEHNIVFSPKDDLLFHRGKRLPYHSNAMRFIVFDEGGELDKEVYYSVGGGFTLSHSEVKRHRNEASSDFVAPYTFETYAELEKHCIRENKKIWEIILANELSQEVEKQVRKGILKIWDVMKASVERGCRIDGILPGGLNVKRRAPAMHRDLRYRERKGIKDPADLMDWVSMFALAVNEENAAGGRVVTAPTNGAAGVIPAVLHYMEKYIPQFNEDMIIIFFLTSGAVATLYKNRASLSAAEMGCQGEVGVACSMAAAGLTAALGGTNSQVENAAEIGMEHNLGLTCDPIGGLVQVPCIERNTMGAIQAINASRLALKGDGGHIVRLDEVITAMREIGSDMHSKYKETSVGGLATSVSVGLCEC